MGRARWRNMWPREFPPKCMGCRCRAPAQNRKCPCCGLWPSTLLCVVCGEQGRFGRRHREVIISCTLVAPGSVLYRIACECGNEWDIGVLTDPATAEDIVASRARG